MNVAIIGGGFTGLTAAYELTKYGHQVTIFEKDPFLGGLAHGFKEPNWDWHLEKAYHHLFTNDTAIIGLMKKLGLEKKLLTIRPVTATLWRERMSQLDSPLSLLRFPGLPMMDKVRTGVLLAAMKLNPFWQPLEYITARKLFETIGGKRSWQTIWEPLMKGKFGPYADTVAASWFWARIKKRTPSLCYIEGGFQTLVNTLEKAIEKQGGKILTNTAVTNVQLVRSSIPSSSSPRRRGSNSLDIDSRFRGNDTFDLSFIIYHLSFDKVLLTVPTPFIKKLAPMISNAYFQGPATIPHLHAHVLILETKEPILKDVYWLNVTDRTYPFLIVGAHTNFVDKKHYGGNHITYFGNYLPEGHPYLSMTKDQILTIYKPFIQRLNPSCQLSAVSCQLFIGHHAQPVHQLHYSQKAPKLDPLAVGPINGLFIANMDSIYPWDRGTNYAVELGTKAAKSIL